MVGAVSRHSVESRAVGRGLALVFSSAAGFAALPILTKIAYSVGASVITVLTYRFLIAALLLWLLLRARRLPLPRSPTAVLFLFGLGIAFVLTALAMFVALVYVPAAIASLVFYSYPALVTIGSAVLFHERPTLLRCALIVLAFSGCFLLFLSQLATQGLVLGAGLAFGSACAYTAYILLGHRMEGVADPLVVSTAVVTVAGVLYGVAAVIGAQLLVTLPTAGWLSIGAIALVSTTLALYAFLRGMAVVGPSAAALASTVEPVITVLLAMLVLHERLAGTQALGGLLVLVSVLALQLDRGGWRPRRQEAFVQPPQDVLAGGEGGR